MSRINVVLRSARRRLRRATDVIGGYHARAGAGVLSELAGGAVDPVFADTGGAARRWL